MKPTASNPLTYKDAGVDIESGNRLVERIKSIAKATQTSGVLGGIGGFGALYELPLDRFRHPVLVSGTDGVGTKLRLAIEANRHDTVGIDLVAMCANDVLVAGAEPLYFLDYFATGRLDTATAERVITGIGKGCELAGAALIGGETAEMPSMYAEGDYDLAGFCVGIVERDRIIDGHAVQPGDALLGLASSGPHSNGYSLIREALEVTATPLDSPFADATLADALLAPTRIYVSSVLELIAAGIDIHALAHITGGGLTENLPRVLPAGTRARVETARWQQPQIFDWLREAGNIEDTEMRRTFNCGIGLVICVSAEDTDRTTALLESAGEHVTLIGNVEASPDDDPEVVFV